MIEKYFNLCECIIVIVNIPTRDNTEGHLRGYYRGIVDGIDSFPA